MNLNHSAKGGQFEVSQRRTANLRHAFRSEPKLKTRIKSKIAFNLRPGLIRFFDGDTKEADCCGQYVSIWFVCMGLLFDQQTIHEERTMKKKLRSGEYLPTAAK
ncbi:hypothetical protein TcasGA2_TC012603 [Tribolium castaneum]|uniref:Uncharacterized protein n=1 Tax=Tribolium castaneum TaxID=7070 RepID=D6WZ45_TRICA|nr:hypothetical protein TcasGA2_TC012603 [Tribolium castaneum]